MGAAQDRTLSAVALAALSLCAPANAASSRMDAMAQATPPKTNIFEPPPEHSPTITPDEILKLKRDLSAARERHPPDGKARAQPTTAPARLKKPR
jgi:hypothetical protein